MGFAKITICAVPRAKAEVRYHANQQLFRATLREAIEGFSGVEDGTRYLSRHTSTRTTHLPKLMPNYDNDGDSPYPGITEKTCWVSSGAEGKNILLVDDIYTRGVNIDEDAINALLKAAARNVAFYAVAKV